MLIHLESDLNEASFNLVKTTKKKLPNNAKVYFVSAKVQLDEKTVIDGLKLFRHPAAKRIIEIFRLEKKSRLCNFMCKERRQYLAK